MSCKENLLQYVTAMTVLITPLGTGCIFSWTSPAMPYLRDKSEFPVSENQRSWIASLYPVGLIIGYMINPLFINRIGRKRTLLLFAIPQIACWLLIVTATNYIHLYIARILGGIGYGAGQSVSTVYLSEIGDRKTRGVFLTLFSSTINLGGLTMMVLGGFTEYKTMNLILLTVPVLFVAIFSFLPDSSYFLQIVKKKEKEELEVMAKLNPLKEAEERGTFELEKVETSYCGTNNFKSQNCCMNNYSATGLSPSSSGTEKFETSNIGTKNFETNCSGTSNLDIKDCGTENFGINSLGTSNVVTSGTNNYGTRNLVTYNFDTKMTGPNNLGTKSLKKSINNFRISDLKKTSMWKMFTVYQHLRALAIVCIIASLYILSGHFAMSTFTQEILTYEGNLMKSEKAAIILASIRTVISITSSQFVERVGRKSILLSSGIITSISIGSVGMFFFLTENGIDISFMNWFPLLGLAIREVSFSCGIGILFFVYQGELFANEIKSEGIALIKTILMGLNFLFMFKFQTLINNLPRYAIFWIFSLCTALGTWICFIITPETKGKSLEEIQILLTSGNRKIK